ncbi:GATA transcription factor 1-like isoform X2 [Nicotiana tomentosiformis]|uniref:GATA transcription factor 1-like isoform X2 n=1 Tax=Nicotiana tomentosiformis TaxID=4098 RepID=UPI00051C83B2|nr:GATA transcription factor 1-like isoform X2 [Nicotiana tomentosiformis]
MNMIEDLDSTACFMVDDDILNFSLDEEKHPSISSSSFSSLDSSNNISFLPDDHSRSFHESVEEELEWLSNKDAFPAVEFDIFSENIPNVIFDHHSPVSVLENSSSSSANNNSCNLNDKENAFMIGCSSLQVPVNYPVRARGKRRRRISFADLTNERCVWGRKLKFKNNKQEWELLSLPMTKARRASIGRRCQHCGVDKTPQWRAGPMGPKTLCNACGVRYKSGRLLPEYRPANSPTFSADLHSNSHRKVLEMRKQRIGI